MRRWLPPLVAWALVATPALGQVAASTARGLAWDGKTLWTLDRDARLRTLEAPAGVPVRELAVQAKAARAMTFDGERFWVADEATMTLSAIDRATGRVLKTLPLPTPAEKGFKSVEGLAWDGKHLWAAYYAGFSSSLVEIDPESGRLVRSVYAECHPRGLASDGARLWTLCSGGPNARPVVDQRPIAGREHEMLGARVFLARVDATEPSGLAFDGRDLVVLDGESRKLLRVPLGANR